MKITVDCPECFKPIIIPLNDTDEFMDLDKATMSKDCPYCKCMFQVDTTCAVDVFQVGDEWE